MISPRSIAYSRSATLLALARFDSAISTESFISLILCTASMSLVTTTGARPSKGSSSSRMEGESIMARAMATIFFWPPLRKRPRLCVSCRTSGNTEKTRSSACAARPEALASKRQIGKQPGVFGRVTDPEPRPAVRRQPADLLPLEGDLAGTQGKQADDTVDGGRLSRAVAAHQADRFLLPYRQRHLAEDLGLAPIRVDALQLKHGWARTPRPSRSRSAGSLPGCRWRGSCPDRSEE